MYLYVPRYLRLGIYYESTATSAAVLLREGGIANVRLGLKMRLIGVQLFDGV